MYLFGLSKEEVLSQKHVVSYKETSKQNPVTLFGRQVFSADHYVEMGFHSAKKEKETALATNWSGKRNPKIVIDLEEPPATELADSISYSNLVKVVDQSMVEDGSSDRTSNVESGLLDLNRAPPAHEVVSEPHYSLLQDLNCPYIEETETSCVKSGTDESPTQLCSPKSQNVSEKDGTASPDSYTSCCTNENNLRTRALDPSCRTRLEFPSTEVLPDQNERCNEEEEEFSHVIQMAAESLVNLSAVSYQDQDLECCSCDSFELHTLGISETNTEEEFCLSSVALNELNNVARDNNREIGLKLRRGRRMKNFQKEIIPSLTSLSRHEIREDVNILEAVLRSREYKKMQGKTIDVKVGANTRNKRSVSQRYVGKKKAKT